MWKNTVIKEKEFISLGAYALVVIQAEKYGKLDIAGTAYQSFT